LEDEKRAVIPPAFLLWGLTLAGRVTYCFKDGLLRFIPGNKLDNFICEHREKARSDRKRGCLGFRRKPRIALCRRHEVKVMQVPRVK
jgi:hypothetical protein